MTLIFAYLSFLACIIAYIVYALIQREIKARQLKYIQSYTFHPALEKKLRAKYPHLNNKQISSVFDGLRDYFTFCSQAKKRMVAMPSQVIDVAWHEFILFTKEYELFSKKAIGGFLHHTPTESMSTPTLAQEGIKRTWRLACSKESIDPSSPSRLPLIFAIDTLLKIKDGFKYSLNCRTSAGDYCAAHIACSSGCAGVTGSSDYGSSGSGGSDCGGGGD